MDPPSDPPPPPPPLDAPLSVAAAANPTPSHPPLHTHPSYAEMITAAVSALNERNGSSRRAIAKYIETHYPDLPPTHSTLLTHNLKRLKVNGNLVMVKHSYKLPRSTPGAVNGVSSDPTSAGSKRRPGRPPKPKPDAVQDAVPVFASPVDMNAMPDVAPMANVATAPVNGPAPGFSARGRGRPPKQSGSKRGRPRKSGGLTSVVGGVSRGRGRPKKNATGAALVGREKGQGRPRGRPRKSVNLVQGLASGMPVGGGIPVAPAAVGVADVGGGTSVTGKRRGRPPKAGVDVKRPRILTTGQPKKPRKLSGKPLGRPRKMPTTQDSQLLVAYLDLKAKLENLQSRVKQTASLIKPYLNNEAVLTAVQELELVATNINTSSNPQRPQPQAQPEQPQSQPQPPPPTHN